MLAPCVSAELQTVFEYEYIFPITSFKPAVESILVAEFNSICSQAAFEYGG